MQRFEVELSLNFLHMQQCFRFRSESQPPAAMRVVQRLHAEMIARQKQHGLARAQIADGERKHSVQALHALRAFLFVEVHQDFGVAIGAEAMAAT